QKQLEASGWKLEASAKSRQSLIQPAKNESLPPRLHPFIIEEMFPTAVAYGIPGLRWRWVQTTWLCYRLWFALRGCEGKLLRLPFLERKPSFAFTPLFRAVS